MYNYVSKGFFLLSSPFHYLITPQIYLVTLRGVPIPKYILLIFCIFSSGSFFYIFVWYLKDLRTCSTTDLPTLSLLKTITPQISNTYCEKF